MKSVFGSSTAGIAAGGVAAVVAIIAGYLVFGSSPAEQPDLATAPATIAEAPAEQATGTEQGADLAPAAEAETGPAPTASAPDDAPAADVADPAADPAPETTVADGPSVSAPTFDNTRIEADGFGTVAGRADPGMMVDILVDGAPVERVTADANGAFMAFVSLPASDQPRVLALLADPNGAAVMSADERLIAPIAAPAIVADGGAELTTPEAPETAGAEAAPATDVASAPEALAEPGEDTVDTSEVAASTVTEPAASGSTDIASVVETDTAGADEVPGEQSAAGSTSPAVLSLSEDGVEVVQPAVTDPSPEVMSSVALDSITYDPAGEVLLAGRAGSDGFVRIYLDNQPVTTSRISEGGNWRTDLPEVDTGVYTLRVDEIDAEGAVISRIETPFKREEPEAIAEVMAEDQTTLDERGVAVRTVQPGNTLWAIARDRYGDGVMYTYVFEANRDRIRNPDLIYPGQIFILPEVGEAQ